jgi:N-methylhydantoinase A
MPIETRPVWIDEAYRTLPTPVYDGSTLRPGQLVAGPAVTDEATTTLLVGVGETLRVTDADNFLIVLAEDGNGSS